MLASVLHTSVAEEVSIRIMRSFVKMWKYFANNTGNNEILKKKYESQYDNITFINNDSFHDWFIIIDKKKLYSCGASFKELGKRCFCIYENNNKEYLSRILKMIGIK